MLKNSDFFTFPQWRSMVLQIVIPIYQLYYEETRSSLQQTTKFSSVIPRDSIVTLSDLRERRKKPREIGTGDSTN